MDVILNIINASFNKITKNDYRLCYFIVSFIKLYLERYNSNLNRVYAINKHHLI